MSRKSGLIAISLFVMVFLLSVSQVFAGAQKIVPELVIHKSELLGTEKKMYVYKPANYDPGKKYPVLYLLHGAYDGYDAWETKSKLGEYLTRHEMFVVLPDGEPFGWYVDSPLIPTSKYESYIPKEVVPYIDSHYSTIASKDGRAICGLSMGGHGAITLGFKYPEVFGSASSLSGCMSLPDLATNSALQIAKKLGSYKKDQKTWEDNSVFNMVLNRKVPNGYQFMLSCGSSDGLVARNRDTHQLLLLMGISHSYVEHPGVHDWVYWDTYIEDHINYHERLFNQARTVTAK